MNSTSVGPLGVRFDDVREIAVLRGGGLGDLAFAIPAITALKAAYPEARLTVLGTPVHAALLEGRPGPVDEVVVLPYAEGVRPTPAGSASDGPADGPAEDPGEVAAFHARMRQRRFDLAVQLHGGGRFSNPFLLALGARHTAGTATPDAAELERTLPYVYHQHEVLRALEVAGLAGAPVVDLEARLTVTEAERAAGSGMRDRARRGLLVLHPGATDPRRRWPTAHFARLAALAAEAGLQVLVVGAEEDVPAAEAIVAGSGAPDAVGSCAGRLGLGDLLGLLAEADVLVGNDSGPRHLAQAVGTATVGLYWVGNLLNAGPLGRDRHRVHLSWITRCPECGIDVTQVGWTAPRCPHDPSYLDMIEPEAVFADVQALLTEAQVLRD